MQGVTGMDQALLARVDEWLGAHRQEIIDDLIGLVLTWIALILTVVSLVDYLVKNRKTK